MQGHLILFSPTGGTEKAARLLASGLFDDMKVIDLTTEIGAIDLPAKAEEAAIIALPSYGGRVPALAAERLRAIHAENMPCVLLCVYGNRAYDDTLVEMEDLAKACGFAVVAAVAAVAEHSIMRQFATGRPDDVDAKTLQSFGEKIAKKLSGGGAEPFTIPGSRPYKKGGGVPLVPKPTSACVSCGLCAASCPAGAIDKADVRRVDAGRCIACMRCVAKCPHAARKVNGMLVSVAALAIKKACQTRKECELYL